MNCNISPLDKPLSSRKILGKPTALFTGQRFIHLQSMCRLVDSVIQVLNSWGQCCMLEVHLPGGSSIQFSFPVIPTKILPHSLNSDYCHQVILITNIHSEKFLMQRLFPHFRGIIYWQLHEVVQGVEVGIFTCQG